MSKKNTIVNESKYPSDLPPLISGTLEEHEKMVVNPMFLNKELRDYMEEAGADIPQMILRRVRGRELGGGNKLIPLAVQGFMDSWRGLSPKFVMAKHTGQIISYHQFSSSPQNPNYPEYSNLILIGDGTFWLYASMEDMKTDFDVYMLPTKLGWETTVQPIGPFPITTILKKIQILKY